MAWLHHVLSYRQTQIFWALDNLFEALNYRKLKGNTLYMYVYTIQTFQWTRYNHFLTPFNARLANTSLDCASPRPIYWSFFCVSLPINGSSREQTVTSLPHMVARWQRLNAEMVYNTQPALPLYVDLPFLWFHSSTKNHPQSGSSHNWEYWRLFLPEPHERYLSVAASASDISTLSSV